jgi:hypothetical protein
MSFARTDTRSGCCNALIVDVPPERGVMHFMEPPPRYACYRCDREVPRGFLTGWRVAEFKSITLPRFIEPSFVQSPASLAELLCSVQPMTKP